jgi:hypothetical protein
MQCRDRLGVLPLQVYKLVTCTMCYSFLFHGGKEFRPGRQPLELVAVNGSSVPYGTIIRPDIDNGTGIDVVCETLSSEDCLHWRTCCRAAVACCKRHAENAHDIVSERPGVCPRTWDGFGCFDDTPAGERVRITCPSYLEHAAPAGKCFHWFVITFAHAQVLFVLEHQQCFYLVLE